MRYITRTLWNVDGRPVNSQFPWRATLRPGCRSWPSSSTFNPWPALVPSVTVVSPRNVAVEIRNSSVVHSFVAAASCCIRADRYSRGASRLVTPKYARGKTWRMTWVVAKRAARIFAGDEPLIVPSLHVRESNRADMKPWNASACNSSQFMIHSRFIGELAETWISNQAGRSFFNCDVQFGAKEFSERRGSRFGFESTKLWKRDREWGFTMSIWICESCERSNL